MSDDHTPDAWLRSAGVDRRSADRMPDHDWLTGLASRGAFARQVTQADRDQDEFAVAIIAVLRIEEINRRAGFEAGDDLLRSLGRAVGQQASVDTTVARLGGARFGMMTVGPGVDNVTDWLDPAIGAMAGAVSTWTFDQIDFSGIRPIEPALVVGAAGGFSGQVWSDAALALDLAETPHRTGTGPAVNVVVHDETDPRLGALRTRARAETEVTDQLDRGELNPVIRAIEPADPIGPDHPWLRLGVPADGGGARRPSHELPSGWLTPLVGRELERWLIGRAVTLLGTESGQIRVTIPVHHGLDLGPDLAEHVLAVADPARVPPSRLVFEVDEAVIDAAGRHGRAGLAALRSIGSDVVLAGADGGLRTARLVDELDTRYVKPAPGLLAVGPGDQSAGRLLTALAASMAERGRDLIAPSEAADGGDRPGPDRLVRLGVRYREADTIRPMRNGDRARAGTMAQP
ncbi:MAG: diguanylate cyclase [Actinomycetota bacterium]